jgi:hypothetical protein
MGAPNLILTDNAQTEIGKKWTKTSRDNATRQIKTAPHNQPESKQCGTKDTRRQETNYHDALLCFGTFSFLVLLHALYCRLFKPLRTKGTRIQDIHGNNDWTHSRHLDVSVSFLEASLVLRTNGEIPKEQLSNWKVRRHRLGSRRCFHIQDLVNTGRRMKKRERAHQECREI